MSRHTDNCFHAVLDSTAAELELQQLADEKMPDTSGTLTWNYGYVL